MKKTKSKMPENELKQEKKILAEEKRIEKMVKGEMGELKSIEQEMKNTQSHPLAKITYKDLVRGSIGAIFGIVGHFAFFYGVEIAEHISVLRATFLYILSLVVCILFMYYSGFRKVKEIKVIRFIPVRATVIYLTALVVVAATLLVFGFIDIHTPFAEIYKKVATNSLLAVLGASTADILGGKHE